MRMGWRDGVAAIVAVAVTAVAATPGQAFLFWNKQTVENGGPVAGGEPGITLPLAGATAKEQLANLVWTMRAGLNVAALQCQFAPSLRTVVNYNNMLRQHSGELQRSYTTLQGYFKRTTGKTWATALDQYTTRTYNSFSTLNAQLNFCEAASSIGRETLDRPAGELTQIATTRMREFRGSLIPRGEQYYSLDSNGIPVQVAGASEFAGCFDKKGRMKKVCS
ncbi:hypothetical protein [uncultured Sphingomonas sp.]|uniref:hypothetical protein n=1 Tax=uncultured Sphingomonas sp. TaxID=158754 RepID=UPI0025E81ADF|nr:hypothetical protein [uncultured Sphingomonas sp.]